MREEGYEGVREECECVREEECEGGGMWLSIKGGVVGRRV